MLVRFSCGCVGTMPALSQAEYDLCCQYRQEFEDKVCPIEDVSQRMNARHKLEHDWYDRCRSLGERPVTVLKFSDCRCDGTSEWDGYNNPTVDTA